jgi:valyl-tRNA synthetase
VAGEFEMIREIVDGVRRVRSEYNVPPSQTIDAFIVALPAYRQMLDAEFTLIKRLAKTALTFAERAPAGPAANVILPGGTELVVPLEGLIDVEKECTRLRTELSGLEKQLASLEARLDNPAFVSRAPAHVVDAERAKSTEWRSRRDLLRARIEGLCGVA